MMGSLEVKKEDNTEKPTDVSSVDAAASTSVLVNASGHVQELKRHFDLLSLIGAGLLIGNAWPAIAGSILVAIFNGGPPGVLYEFIAVSLFYFAIAASIAELASAIPSSGGVYHWASVTPGRNGWGRPVGFFAGWWNYFTYTVGAASVSSISANTIIQMYALNHPRYKSQTWHVFITYLALTWVACVPVCLLNRAMPILNNMGMYAVVGGFIITVVVVTVMPGRGGRPPHASSSFVWTEWVADIGYSDGFVSVAGMLNGAFALGPVDAVTHLAEEIPFPHRNIPIVIGLQLVIGIVTAFAFLIAIMYAINDYGALFDSPYPIANVYYQATGSAAGASGLLFIIVLCLGLSAPGIYLTAGRTLWALARDGAAPVPRYLGAVDKRFDMPLWSTLATGALVTLLGCVFVGSPTAYNAFVASFILFSTSSFLAAILPHMLTGRKNVKYGPFYMRGWFGFLVNGTSCGYMLVWFVIYSFPYSLPTNAETMNYSCLIWGGLTALVGIWWLARARKGYVGPQTRGGAYVGDMLGTEGLDA
ncbi:amino acid permease [Xylariomycetidae sp. FL2044]|nr:amino acid permease [Xylariomycetidae sp. FL2044]